MLLNLGNIIIMISYKISLLFIQEYVLYGFLLQLIRHIMINGRQIRAARALLEWDAEQLASKTGLSRDTVFNIEKGSVQARGGSIEKIVRAFSDSGIEFTDNQGVRLKPHSLETFEGRDGFVHFFETMHEHLRTHGGDICVSGVDESLFLKYQGNFADTHMARMAELAKQRPDLKMRILIAEDDHNFVASSYASYRWQSKEMFSPTAFYVFGDCLALISFTHDPAPLVILIKSAAFAEAYRHSFNFAWSSAREPAPKKSK